MQCRSLNSQPAQNRSRSEPAWKRHRPLQNLQIFHSRNFTRAELLEMRRLPLCVEQHETALPQSFNQCDERDFGGEAETGGTESIPIATT